MITAPPAPEHAETEQVRAATVRKLAGKRTPREKQADKARQESGHHAASTTKAAPKSATKKTSPRKADHQGHHQGRHHEGRHHEGKATS